MMEFAHDGAIIFNLLVAGVLTLVLGVVALLLLQRAILRNMMRAGGHAFTPPADARPRRTADAALAFDDAAAAAAAACPAACCGAMRSRIRSPGWRSPRWRRCCCCASAAWSSCRCGPRWSLWAFAWPTVLILGLLVGRDRRLQALIVLGYLGVLAIICAVAELRGTRAAADVRRHRAGLCPARHHLAVECRAVGVPAAVPQPHDPVDRPAGAAVRVRHAARQPRRDHADAVRQCPRRRGDDRHRAQHRRRLRSSGSCRRSARWSCSGRPGAASPGCATATPPSDRANCC